MSNYNDQDGPILLKKLEPNHLDHIYKNQMTTVYYPDEQLSSYQHTVVSTTPMNDKYIENVLNKNLATTPSSSSSKVAKSVTQSAWHPSNHRRKYSNVLRNSKNLMVSFENDVEIPQEERTFFPSNDDDEENFYDDYMDSTQQSVNNIQDILDQNNDENNQMFNNGIGIVSSSMPFSRTVKIQGIYMREKKKNDHFEAMETNTNGQITELHNVKDPFLKFKPSSPGDVNLLATPNQHYQFSTYSQHRPKPLTSVQTGAYNKYFDEYAFDSNQQNPNYLQQPTKQETIAMNKQKPFSLMLDVYPMTDDDTILSTTRMTPFHPYTRPFYPVNLNAMTHYSQYGKENPYYNQLKFPQLQQYRSPLYTNTHSQNDAFFRNYMLNRMNPNFYHSISRQQSHSPITLTSEDTPSHITVHLNLYPNQNTNQNPKIFQERNFDVMDTNDMAGASSQLDTISVWTPIENSKNLTKTTATNFNDSNQKDSVQIPPFSALKINELQYPFNINKTHLYELKKPPSNEYYDGFDAKSKGFTLNRKYDEHQLDVDVSSPASFIQTTMISFDDKSPIVTTMPTIPTSNTSSQASSMYTKPTSFVHYFATKSPFITSTR